MPILTEQRERRDVQPIPTDADGATVKFVCGVYRCTMSGQTCRDYHANAVEFRPENREACIDCPAGKARLTLLGGGDSPVQGCTGKTKDGSVCRHPPLDGGLCRSHRAVVASKTSGAAKLGQETRKKKSAAPRAKTAPSTPAPRKTENIPVPPKDLTPAPQPPQPPQPSPTPAPAPAAPAAPACASCKRDGCERPAGGSGGHAEYCRWCQNSAYVTLRKGLLRVPLDAETVAWLERTPVHRHFRRRESGVYLPVTVSTNTASPGLGRKAPPGSKGIDWSVQPLGEMSDVELSERIGCSTTAVRTQRKKRGIAPMTAPSPATLKPMRRMPRHKARLEIGERLCKLLAVHNPPSFYLFPVGDVEWGFSIDPHDKVSMLLPNGDLQFNETCWRPADDVIPPVPDVHVAVSPEAVAEVLADEPIVTVVPASSIPDGPPLVFDDDDSAGKYPRPIVAGVGMGSCPTAISELPDHLVLITIPLNRHAYAELERMAAAGLHGDDPCDAARTLILDGLRRHAMVRL